MFISVYILCNVLPCHAAHLPTIKRPNMQTVLVVFVTVKKRPNFNFTVCQSTRLGVTSLQFGHNLCHLFVL